VDTYKVIICLYGLEKDPRDPARYQSKTVKRLILSDFNIFYKVSIIQIDQWNIMWTEVGQKICHRKEKDWTQNKHTSQKRIQNVSQAYTGNANCETARR
jgi:hypothetical protein